MAELWNYIIVESIEPSEVANDVRELLGLRGWRSAIPSEEGSSRCSVWQSENGFVVIDLKDWEDADPKLARELATRRKVPVVVSFFDGAGETELYEYVNATGRKSRPPHTTLAALASSAAWDLQPTGDMLEISVMTSLDGASRRIVGALHRWVAPILTALRFRKTRLEVRYHPAIEAVRAWTRKFNDTTSLVVRFDYSKGDVLRDCTQSILVQTGATVTTVGELTCDNASRWAEYPEMVERDFEMLTAQLVKVLLAQVSNEDREILRQFQPLADSFDALLASRRILRVVEPNDVPASLVFCGERLMTVRTEGQQFTFKFDTSSTPERDRITVGDIVELRGGERRARRLRLGQCTLTFDELGNAATTLPNGDLAPART
jgi:hypothetical protein